MKHLSFSIAILTLGFVTLVGAPAKENPANSRPVRLQLTVDLPASMSMIRDDDISDAFAYRLSAGLHEQGFQGRINYFPAGENPKKDLPLLSISLIEWRVNLTGNVQCTFSARLSGPSGEKDLGLFSGDSLMMWPRHDISARADGFSDAAKSALGDLSQKIEASKLVPTLPK